jgi:hypothetical protein
VVTAVDTLDYSFTALFERLRMIPAERLRWL